MCDCTLGFVRHDTPRAAASTRRLDRKRVEAIAEHLASADLAGGELPVFDHPVEPDLKIFARE